MIFVVSTGTGACIRKGNLRVTSRISPLVEAGGLLPLHRVTLAGFRQSKQIISAVRLNSGEIITHPHEVVNA